MCHGTLYRLTPRSLVEPYDILAMETDGEFVANYHGWIISIHTSAVCVSDKLCTRRGFYYLRVQRPSRGIGRVHTKNDKSLFIIPTGGGALCQSYDRRTILLVLYYYDRQLLL